MLYFFFDYFYSAPRGFDSAFLKKCYHIVQKIPMAKICYHALQKKNNNKNKKK